MASDAAAADPEQPGEQTSLLARTAPRSSGAGAGGPAAASAAGGAGTSSQEQRFTDGGQAKAVRRWRCSVSPKALLGLVLVALVVVCLHYFSAERLHTLFTSLQGDPLTSAVLFFIFNALGVVFMLPGMVLSIGAGAVFGFWRGAVLSWVATSVGTTLAFVLGRYLLADTVEAYVKDKWVSGRPSRRGRRGPAGGGCVGGCATPQLVCVPHPPRPAAPPTPHPPPPRRPRRFPSYPTVETALAKEGWKLVLLLKVAPMSPWNVLNYVMSATPLSLAAFALPSAVAAIPYVLLFSYMGRWGAGGSREGRRGGAGQGTLVGWVGAVRCGGWPGFGDNRPTGACHGRSNPHAAPWTQRVAISSGGPHLLRSTRG
jgi:uncharacterized membrane protein YdjX (TVP38/TMEM64 family)